MATWREALNVIAQNIPVMVNTILEYENLELRREEIILGQDRLSLETDRYEVDKVYKEAYGALMGSEKERLDDELEISAGYADLVDDYTAQLQTIHDTKNPDLQDDLLKTLNLLEDKMRARLKNPGGRTFDENQFNAQGALYTLEFLKLLNVPIEDRQKMSEQMEKGDFLEAAALAVASGEYSEQFRRNLEGVTPLMQTLLEAAVKSSLAQEPYISRDEYLQNTLNGLYGKDAEQNWFEDDEVFNQRTGISYERDRKKHDQGNYGNVFLVMDSLMKLFPQLRGVVPGQEQGAEIGIPDTGFRPRPYTTTPEDYARSRLGVVNNPYLPAQEPMGEKPSGAPVPSGYYTPKGTGRKALKGVGKGAKKAFGFADVATRFLGDPLGRGGR